MGRHTVTVSLYLGTGCNLELSGRPTLGDYQVAFVPIEEDAPPPWLGA